MLNKSVIIYSTENLYNGNSAAASRVLNYSKALVASNCKVYLCSFGYDNIFSISEIENNIFLFGKSFPQHKNSIIKQIFLPFKIFFFIREIYKNSKLLIGRVTFLLYPSTKISIELFSILYLVFLKRQSVYLETNEVRKYDNMFFHSKSSESLKRKIYLTITRTKFFINEYFKKYFSGLVCISTNIQKYYEKYNKNIIRIPILCDIPKGNNIKVNTFKIPGKFLIAFTGWVAIEKDNLHMFLESLSDLKTRYSNFEFHLYGKINKVNKKLLDTLISNYQLNENVFYKGFVSQSDLSEILKGYHLLVIPRGYNLQNNFGFSTKLSDYIISGVPFLITDVSDNKKFINDNFNGFIVPPDDKSKMTEKILWIIHNYDQVASDIVKNARNTAKQHFYYLNYSESLKSFLFPNKLAN